MERLSSEELSVYDKVREDLELKILNGTYKEGERIEAVRVIGEMYGIGPNTAHRILRDMREDNLLILERGKGQKIASGAAKRLMELRQKTVREDLRRICMYAEALQMDPMDEVKQILKKKKK